jgi:hypothetical protein
MTFPRGERQGDGRASEGGIVQDRARRWRNIGLSVVLAGGMVAAAGASILNDNLVICAPSSVLAGNPIDGYVVGLEGPATVAGLDSLGNPLAPAFENSGGVETHFFFPTHEPMAGTCVTIRARDADETLTASVAVL